MSTRLWRRRTVQFLGATAVAVLVPHASVAQRVPDKLNCILEDGTRVPENDPRCTGSGGGGASDPQDVSFGNFYRNTFGRLFGEGTSSRPAGPDELASLAQKYLNSSNRPKLLSIKNPLTLNVAGVEASNRGEFRDAVTLFEAALANHPNGANQRIIRGNLAGAQADLAFRLGDLQTAVTKAGEAAGISKSRYSRTRLSNFENELARRGVLTCAQGNMAACQLEAAQRNSQNAATIGLEPASRRAGCVFDGTTPCERGESAVGVDVTLNQEVSPSRDPVIPAELQENQLIKALVENREKAKEYLAQLEAKRAEVEQQPSNKRDVVAIAKLKQDAADVTNHIHFYTATIRREIDLSFKPPTVGTSNTPASRPPSSSESTSPR